MSEERDNYKSKVRTMNHSVDYKINNASDGPNVAI